MVSKLFELCTMVPRMDLESGEKVECLEYSVGCLFVGTSLGNLLQFGVVERDGRFTSNFITSKQVATNKNKVSYLYAAPTVNRLLVFVDSGLLILNMSDLTSLQMGGSNKLRGLTAVCVDQVANPYTVEICVAKGKQCQLALLSLTEEKLSVLKTRETATPVQCMAMCGGVVCAALQTEYIIYHMTQSTTVTLFPRPTEQLVCPPIIRVGSDQFLVSGPGNLGIFVKADGSAGHPPIQWSHRYSSLAYESDLILGLAPDLVSVNRIEGSSGPVQVVTCPGVRCMSNCGGTLLVGDSMSVYCLSQVPWQQQADSLLESGHELEAVDLAQRNEGPDVNCVIQKAGFMAFQRGEWEKSLELLIDGHTDPREVISLFPGMLPANSKFVRSNPPLHNIPDVKSLNFVDKESPLIFLRKFLEVASSAHKTDIDTAKVKVLTQTSPSEVAKCLESEDFRPDLRDLAEFFGREKYHHFLAIVHKASNNLDEAIKIWSMLVTGDLNDSHFPGLEFFCSELSACPPNIIFSYCDVALNKNEKIASSLFERSELDLTREDDLEYVDSVINILNKYPRARQAFLKFLVLDKSSQIEKHHTLLAIAFINQVKNTDELEAEMKQELKDNIHNLILSSKYLNASFLLQNLQDTDLEYEKAILHGKTGDHDKALDILVNKLHDYTLAENYCDDISGADSVSRANLLQKLLNCYLNPLDPKEKDRCTVLAVELVNRRADQMNGQQVLTSLPVSWNISIILPGLRKISRKLMHEERMTKISKHLYKGENIQLRNKWVTLTREPIVIQPNHYCVICNKGFSGTSIARYPNGVTLHADCVTDDTVCPLTGTVFTIKK